MVHHPAAHYSGKSRSFHFISRVAAALALALSLGAGAYAQEQQDQPQADKPQPTQDAPPKPTYAPQDADKPPYSHDRPVAHTAQDAPLPPAPAQSVPGTLTVPAGTVLVIRTNDFLSTDRNQVGDQFTATLDQPLIVNGWVVARRGQTIVGKVKDVRKAGRVKGTSELGVELTDLTVVDGNQGPILTELWKGSGGTSHGQDAATIGTTTFALWIPSRLTLPKASKPSCRSIRRITRVADKATGEAHAWPAAIPDRTDTHTLTPTVTMARITTPIRTLGCITVAGAEVITAGAVSVAEPARNGLNENRG